MKLAILGAGGIGAEVAAEVAAGHLPGVRVVGVAGRGADSERAAAVAARVGSAAVDPSRIPELEPDWVLEAAGVPAARSHLLPLLDAGIDVILMSIGALLDDAFLAAVEERRRRGGRVELPSGGIAGLDGVRALAATGGLREASITSTKAPRGLAGAPYLVDNAIELPADRSVTVFEGTAREAIRGFPANVNVAAALSLAGVGPDRTTVRIVSDPSATRTRHQIVALGEAAEIRVEVLSNPHPDNPRTSFLAALSAIDAVRRMAGPAAHQAKERAAPR